jgi:hypothetical protein
MVASALDDVIDRRITWMVAQSAAFRDRGPKWKPLAEKFKRMGLGYPQDHKRLRRRYEESLLTIAHQRLSKNCTSEIKINTSQGFGFDT